MPKIKRTIYIVQLRPLCQCVNCYICFFRNPINRAVRDLIKCAINISANASNSPRVQIFTLSLDRAGGSLIHEIYGFFLNNSILPILFFSCYIKYWFGFQLHTIVYELKTIYSCMVKIIKIKYFLLTIFN